MAAIGLVQRHRPRLLVGGIAGGTHLLDERLIVAEEAGDVPAEGALGRPGQGRDVDDGVDALLGCQDEAVRHDQAALRIGVEHLDGRAAADRDHVAKGQRRTRRHAVGAHQVAGHLGRHPERGELGERGEDRPRAGHVVLHLRVDEVRGLQGDAARVVHDPLADHRQAAGRRGGPIGQLDHPRRLGAAGVDAEEAADAHLDEGVLVEDLDLEAELGAELRGDLPHPRRAEVVVRRVRQVARQHRGRGEGLAAPGPGACGGDRVVGDDEGQAADALPAGTAAERVVAIARQEDALHDGLGRDLDRHVAQPVELDGELVVTGRGPREGGGGVTDRGRVESGGITHAARDVQNAIVGRDDKGRADLRIESPTLQPPAVGSEQIGDSTGCADRNAKGGRGGGGGGGHPDGRPSGPVERGRRQGSDSVRRHASFPSR